MAHKKGQGSVKNGRDSESKRLGLKSSFTRRLGRKLKNSIADATEFFSSYFALAVSSTG